MSGQRTTIVGDGAMGGAFGAALARAARPRRDGLDVAQTLVDAINRDGIAGMGKPMLHDVEAGRTTEVERTNGAVVMWPPRRWGIEAPLNRAMLGLIHGLELSRGRPAPLRPGW